MGGDVSTAKMTYYFARGEPPSAGELLVDHMFAAPANKPANKAPARPAQNAPRGGRTHGKVRPRGPK